MKTSELMIGDLLYLNRRPVRVDAIGFNGSISYSEKGGFGGIGVDKLSPIPITEEILVKNGFEYAYNEASEMRNKQLLVANIGGHYIEVRLDKKNVAIWYDYDENGDGVYSDVLIDLPHHVHNFQHLLRLCGIEKELTI